MIGPNFLYYNQFQLHKCYNYNEIPPRLKSIYKNDMKRR